MTPRVGGVSELPAWFDHQQCWCCQKKRRGAIHDRPRAAKVLKYLYQTTFALKAKGLWTIREEKNHQSCRVETWYFCTKSSLAHGQYEKLLPSVGRWLGHGGRSLPEKDLRIQLGHKGFNLHPHCKGPYPRERSSPWGIIPAHNLSRAVVLWLGKVLACLVSMG